MSDKDLKRVIDNLYTCYSGEKTVRNNEIKPEIVMPAKAGIQEFIKLVPGLRREDD